MLLAVALLLSEFAYREGMTYARATDAGQANTNATGPDTVSLGVESKIKVISFSQYTNGGYINKRFVNKKVNLKAYSGKTFKFTIAKAKGLKKRIDLRNGSYASMSVETDYYNYKYTY